MALVEKKSTKSELIMFQFLLKKKARCYTWMDVNFIKNFFRQNFNISLNDEWLDEVTIYLRSLDFDGDSLLTAVYEQWLYADLSYSSQPLLTPLIDKRLKRTMLQGITVVQVNSIIDISTSLYSQYKKLTYEFEDNSGFQLKSEEEANSDFTAQNPKRMLSMEVTDGQLLLKAVEYRPIDSLSLFTCPGCKILLTNRVRCRRGILLLTDLNCVILGGDSELLMKTGRPVEVMTKYLNIGSISSKEKVSALKKIKNEETRPQTQNVRNNFSVQSNNKPIMEVKPLSEEEKKITTPKSISAHGITRIKRSVNSIKQQVDALRNENRFSSANETSSTTPTSKRANKSPTRDGELKRIKMEVCEEENDIIVIENPKTVKKEIVSVEDSVRNSKSSAHDATAENPIVTAYKKLGAELIAKALQSMRYALGPKRKILFAVMETKPIKPLHINDDGLWALTVALSDESFEGLTCNVSHTFLVELIGWTPEEALAARASKDAERRKEGTLRTRTAGQSMRRLDLIWEVEFFPPDSSVPIIHRIDTYAQKFGLI